MFKLIKNLTTSINNKTLTNLQKHIFSSLMIMRIENMRYLMLLSVKKSSIHLSQAFGIKKVLCFNLSIFSFIFRDLYLS